MRNNPLITSAFKSHTPRQFAHASLRRCFRFMPCSNLCHALERSIRREKERGLSGRSLHKHLNKKKRGLCAELVTSPWKTGAKLSRVFLGHPLFIFSRRYGDTHSLPKLIAIITKSKMSIMLSWLRSMYGFQICNPGTEPNARATFPKSSTSITPSPFKSGVGTYP